MLRFMIYLSQDRADLKPAVKELVLGDVIFRI